MDSGRSDFTAWINGDFLPETEARIPVWDMGFSQGVAVCAHLRTFGHRLFRLDDYLDRFFQSAVEIGIEIPDRSETQRAVEILVERNTPRISKGSDLGTVIFATAGDNPSYVGQNSQPRLGAHCYELPFERWSGLYESGVHLHIASHNELPRTTIDPQIKHRSRLDWFLATRLARQHASDAIPLASTADGELTETPAANLFVVKGGILKTPPRRLVFPGITRAVVLELASSMGLPTEETNLAAEALLDADEAFLTSTPYAVVSVTRVNDRLISQGRPGPVAIRIRDAWNKLVGFDIVRQAAMHAEPATDGPETPTGAEK